MDKNSLYFRTRNRNYRKSTTFWSAMFLQALLNKMKKKEVPARLNIPIFGGLIIFVLAVLVTGGSWFYTQRTPPETYHGIPAPFYISFYGQVIDLGGKMPEGAYWKFDYLFLDLLFWFLMIFGVWQVVKWMKGRHERSN